MKLKQLPSDFIVDEINSFTPDPDGKFFVYSLRKTSLATMEALGIIAKANGQRVKTLSASGLKDKHGVTTQLFSSQQPIKTPFEHELMEISFIGKCTEKLTAKHIDGNKFQIVIRGLREEEVAVIPNNLQEIRDHGLPNYYDNQRFGGIAHGQGFIAKALLRGEFEEAMRLHLAVPHRKQNMRDKSNRRLAQKMWGEWERLHKKMRKSSERALIEFLRDNPDEFAECFDRITPTLRNLFVAAYQSYLFNETVRLFIEAKSKSYASTKYKAGVLSFPRGDCSWADVRVPQLGSSTDLTEYPEVASFVQQVLDAEEVELSSLKLTGLSRTRFKPSVRSLLLKPIELIVGEVTDDEENEDRKKIEISFQLPKGCFATMVTRRLVLGAHERECDIEN
ncbi:MAG: tRNA pseudouridine(13) synthase TruD [Planctomycetes bacterium]|nr:tRNA pseudouridine(13) synthase TruD [Planctomycetota bacterium]